MKRLTRNRMTTSALALLMTACGGGGGGGGDPLPPPPAGIDPAPFATPVVVYTGKQDQAVVDRSNAYDLGGGSLLLLPFLLVTVDFFVDVPPGTDVDETVSGSNGGSLRVRAQTDSGGLGWVASDFDNYSEPGVFVDGLLQQRDRANERILEFTGFTMRAGEFEGTLTGTIRFTDQSVDDPPYDRAVAHLLVTADDDVAFLENITIDRTRLSNASSSLVIGVSVDGRVFDATHGYIDIATSQPLETTGDIFPVAGVLSAVGSDSEVVVHQLSDHVVTLQLQSPVSGGQWATLRTDLSELLDTAIQVPVGTDDGPVAHASYHGITDNIAELSGLASLTRGDDYLRHEWRLMQAPLGSAATMVRTDHPIAQVQMDLAGVYVVELKVISDSGSVDVDRYAFEVDIANSDGTYFRRGGEGRLRIDPVPNASIGSEITLDSRSSSIPAMAQRVLYQWSATLPPGSLAEPDGIGQMSPDLTTLSFTPDIPGVYRFGLSAFEDLPGPDYDDMASVRLTVGLEHAFDASVRLQTEDDGLHYGALVGNLDGDDYADIVSWQALDDYYDVLASGGDAGLAVIGQIALPDPYGVALADLDADGVDEIVVPTQAEVQVYTVSEGALQVRQRLPIATPCPQCNDFLFQSAVVEDLDGDGRADIFVSDTHREALLVFRQDATGNFEALADVPVSDPWNTVLADVTADASVDIVWIENNTINIRAGNGDGTFDDFAAIAAGQQRLVVHDVDGDGLNDIVACFNNLEIEIHTQLSDGGFADPVVVDVPVPGTCSTADIDGDGDKELLLSSLDLLGIIQPDSEGNLTHVTFSTNVTDDFGIADLDGDGLRDIVHSGGRLEVNYRRP